MAHPADSADFSNFLTTGEIIFKGQSMDWKEYTATWQTDMILELQILNDNRDISSDIENLPGRKPYFCDDWYYQLRPRKQKKGYPFQISPEGTEGSPF